LDVRANNSAAGLSRAVSIGRLQPAGRLHFSAIYAYATCVFDEIISHVDRLFSETFH